MNNIKEIIDWLKLNYSENEYVSEDLAYTAFLVSLIPVPGIQQTGQILDRIFSKKSLEIQIKDVWTSIRSIEESLEAVSEDVEKVKEIASIVNSQGELKERVEKIIQESIADIKEDKDSEWILETENWSYQEVLNSIVHADTAKIVTRNNSSNVLEDTEIRAKRTHLHASYNSRNFLNRTNFTSPGGSVGMQGISTQGNIFIEGSSVGFGENSALIFGGNPNLVKGNCPFCGMTIELDKRQLVGHTQIQCPNPVCQRILPFTIN